MRQRLFRPSNPSPRRGIHRLNRQGVTHQRTKNKFNKFIFLVQPCLISAFRKNPAGAEPGQEENVHNRQPKEKQGCSSERIVQNQKQKERA